MARAVSGKRESRSLDFKSAFDPASQADWCEIIKDIVAFANTGGGAIVIGLEDDAEVADAGTDAEASDDTDVADASTIDEGADDTDSDISDGATITDDAGSVDAFENDASVAPPPLEEVATPSPSEQ